MVMSAGLVAGWYFWARHQNRARAVQVLHWIEGALAGQGHVTGIRWRSASEFEVPIRMSSTPFRKANIQVRFSPREFPLQWVLARLKRRRDPEMFTFQADLDLQPKFNMNMISMRWFARSRKDLDTSDRGWEFGTGLPLVLTTRLDWQKEITCAMQSLIGCEQRENLNLIFKKSSPHFSATMPLESLSPDGGGAAFFQSLRAVVEGAAAKSSF